MSSSQNIMHVLFSFLTSKRSTFQVTSPQKSRTKNTLSTLNSCSFFSFAPYLDSVEKGENLNAPSYSEEWNRTRVQSRLLFEMDPFQ
ncbi:hypothetical protein CEXT_133201 [Caerostris extrusa]|uniref:Uncharacterized protein n=1 Tax=Caerostris extrusa TaxID=172846 RepID=A0AAV4P9F2_CAEEX|nr:hypothetical protein CEXT_133201 [Caerostris extrusa]